MLRHALELGTTRTMRVYWGARREVDLYDEAWLLDLAKRYPVADRGDTPCYPR